jgi:ankyrin repeat protein
MKGVDDSTASAHHTKVRFERFDSSTDEKRDEKNVYRYIQRMEFKELARHLIATEERFDILKTYDRSGQTPLHFATYRNIDQAIELLIEFVTLF